MPRSRTGIEDFSRRVIVISIEPTHNRSGKRLYRAEYPDKMYAGFGRTRAHAIGRLLLETPTAEYLDFRIEGK